jgi:hypothetical protein
VTEVKKISALVPVSDEDIVDFGIGTQADQEAAAVRIERERVKMERYWRRLPLGVRLARTLRPRLSFWLFGCPVCAARWRHLSFCPRRAR